MIQKPSGTIAGRTGRGCLGRNPSSYLVFYYMLRGMNIILVLLNSKHVSHSGKRAAKQTFEIAEI